MEKDEQCETMIREYQPFRLGLGDGCHETKQCPNAATLLITVAGQGKMRMCDTCLPKFRVYATLPYTVQDFKRKKGARRGKK